MSTLPVSVNRRKQLSVVLDRLINLSLQVIVLAVEAISIVFCESCYTEVVTFYTEPDNLC